MRERRWLWKGKGWRERATWDLEGGKIEKKVLGKRDGCGGCMRERQKWDKEKNTGGSEEAEGVRE